MLEKLKTGASLAYLKVTVTPLFQRIGLRFDRGLYCNNDVTHAILTAIPLFYTHTHGKLLSL